MKLTFQERFDDENDILNEKVFSLMIDAGLDPNWSVGGSEFNKWFRTLYQNDPNAFHHLTEAIVESIPNGRADWKEPHRVDKQQGARGRAIAEKGGRP